MPKPFDILTAEQVIERLKGRRYKYAQVHHTWKPNHSSFNGKNHIRLQESMWRYHTQTRGWSDIGQHLSLMPDGLFVTGRDFGRTPAGIKGKNTGSFMIELIGNFDIGNDQLEGAQLEATLKVYQYLMNECGAEIIFHREYASKSCPGTGIDKAWFVDQVTNYKRGGRKMNLEHQWQWDMLAEALENLHNKGALDTNEWAEKAINKDLTVDELLFVNTVLLDRKV